MSDRQRIIETRVGLFVLIGLSIIAVMAVQFGRLGQGLRAYYNVTVQLANAGGILKGSDVLLAGARIGHVSSKPVILGSAIDAVAVELSILDHIKLPNDTTFTVGSSGLLGDRFIQVSLPPDFKPDAFDPSDPAEVLQPGSVIKGAKAAGGINELAEKGGEVVDDLKESLARVQELTERISTGVLSEENLENLSTTFANLKITSERFAASSGNLQTASSKIEGVLDEARVVVSRAGNTLDTTGAAAEDLRLAIADSRKVIAAAADTLDEAREGEGALAALLGDRELSENLQALVKNLRRHGVLFYKDSGATPDLGEPVPVRSAQPVRPPHRR